MESIKSISTNDLEITFQDDPIKLTVKKVKFVKDVIDDSKGYHCLGANTMEGREDMTFWKSKDEMKKHISERKESLRK